MEEKYASEDFLTRWLAGELSKEELEGFKASDVYREIMAIDNAAKTLSGPKIDVESALSRVASKNQKAQKAKTIDAGNTPPARNYHTHTHGTHKQLLQK